MIDEQMINAALIGLGNIAWKYDARNSDNQFPLTQGGAFIQHKEVELVGGCSPDIQDREQFSAWSGGLPVFASQVEMLKKLKPEIVGVCSPTPSHYDSVICCLDHGVKMIWLEKPPANSLTQLQELLQLSEKYNATICVNYFRRYLPQYTELKNLLEKKTYGELINLRLTYSPGLARNGVHLLDQIFYLTDANFYELLWVEKGMNLDSPSFALRLSSGAMVFGCGGNLPYHTNDISAQCSGGTFSISQGGINCESWLMTKNEVFPGFFNLLKTESVLNSAGIDGYMQRSLDDLLYSAKNHILPRSNLYSARLSQQLLQDILYEANS